MAFTQQMSETNDDLVKDAVGALAGKGNGVSRSAGILTKVDIIAIKLYVKKGLSLPSALPEVEGFLKYQRIGIAGLEPSDIQILFRDIKTHTTSWAAIEDQMVKQSINLGIAARNILSTGGDILDIINEMPATIRAQHLWGVWSEQEIASIKYTADDGFIAVEVGQIIKSMKTDVLKQQSRTQELLDQIVKFRVSMSGGQLSDGTLLSGLQGQMDGKYKLMERNNFIKSIAEDKVAITEKKERIVQLDADYKKFCELTATGIAGGLIGLAITGGIFGSKAEDARREREVVKSELITLEARVRDKENLQAALEENMRSFADIRNRMLDAEQALNLVKLAWDTILTSITTSAEKFLIIDDAARLNAFRTAFKNVIEPWNSVKDEAGKLVVIFNEALEEYKNNYN